MPDFPLTVWIVIAGVLGLIVGSFLNVVILRLPMRLEAFWQREARDILGLEQPDEPLPPGIVHEGSHCPHCKHPLAAHDNNPRFLRHGPTYGQYMVANACMHCQDPACMIECPTGAIHRDRVEAGCCS